MALTKTATDPQLEKKGIDVLIAEGTTLVTTARMGGSNKKFVKRFDEISEDYRRQVELNPKAQNAQREDELTIEAYSETCIMAWREKIGEDEKTGEAIFESGIAPSDLGIDPENLPKGVTLNKHGLVPVTIERVYQILTNPANFDEAKYLISQAATGRMFRGGMEKDAKNS